MNSLIIGISSGLFIIGLIIILNGLNKKIMYGLILSGIGFLYVGFVWTDPETLCVNAIQAVLFIFLAYYGITKSGYILAAGYFLHGCWDVSYHFFADPLLIPPHYDSFCMSLDFTICVYILLLNKQMEVKKSILKVSANN